MSMKTIQYRVVFGYDPGTGLSIYQKYWWEKKTNYICTHCKMRFQHLYTSRLQNSTQNSSSLSLAYTTRF